MNMPQVTVAPEKAQFRTDEDVRFAVSIRCADSESRRYTITIVVCHLATEVHRQTITAETEHGVLRLPVCLGRFDTDGAAYGVDLHVQPDTENTPPTGSRGPETKASWAFDIASDPATTARYGFVAHFGKHDFDQADIDWLVRLHITMVQFYDWMFRHHQLVPQQEIYKDLMGKENSRTTLTRKIDACTRAGMLPVAYGAIYGAGLEFGKQHPDWCLYDGRGEMMKFINVFAIMNVAPDSPWRDHIVDQYRQALAELGFGGIHMDTYGRPRRAWGRIVEHARLEDLAEQIPLLIEHTRETLSDAERSPTLVFNNVSGWPMMRTGNADVVYVEVWEPYTRYRHLRDLITAGLRSGNGKPVVLAAYLPAFHGSNPSGAVTGLLLATAVIASFGATHLIHGEGCTIITQGYYVDAAVLPTHGVPNVVAYQDFLVRYMELLQDRTLEDVTLTHTGGDAPACELEGHRSSADGDPNRVWMIVRENEDCTLICLVNLIGNGDEWASAKQQPPYVEGLEVRLRDVRRPAQIYTASPDEQRLSAQQLLHRDADDGSGDLMVIDLPPLHIWSIIWIEWGPDPATG